MTVDAFRRRQSGGSMDGKSGSKASWMNWRTISGGNDEMATSAANEMVLKNNWRMEHGGNGVGT